MYGDSFGVISEITTTAAEVDLAILGPTKRTWIDDRMIELGRERISTIHLSTEETHRLALELLAAIDRQPVEVEAFRCEIDESAGLADLYRCNRCGLAYEGHSSGLCDSCETQERFEKASEEPELDDSFLDLVETAWAYQMGGELLITEDAGEYRQLPLADLVSRFRAQARELIDSGFADGQMDGAGNEIDPEIGVSDTLLASRIATALRIVFYGGS